MNLLSEIYRPSLSLLTDLYQLTMSYGYWKSQTADKEAVFHLFFRKNPFSGGFSLAAGLRFTVDFLQSFQFANNDIDYLSSLKGHDGKPLFEPAFLDYLNDLKFSCDIDAVADGTVVFPHEPMVRVTGPIIQCQLLETALLNIWNFQTLIATKAARIREIAGSAPVLEFGARRSQGIDGALTASWSAYIGGCDATSNLLAGKLFNIPVSGTHAHSWIMCFDNELEAFQKYAESMPNNCVFLVDTYDTITGIKHAIEVGKWLGSKGKKLLGIRLDSGDLAYLSIQARKMLDEAGFSETQIIASNDLDETIMTSLNAQGAKISAWGIGTKLVTAYDQPALGCVYKLAAIRSSEGNWQYKIKLSEQTAKISTPGIQQVRRYQLNNEYIGDCIFDESNHPGNHFVIVDPLDMTRRKQIPQDALYQDLLQPVFRQGRLVTAIPSTAQTKSYAQEQLSLFHPGIKRLLNPHSYPVGLELNLHRLKTDLIMKARGLES